MDLASVRYLCCSSRLKRQKSIMGLKVDLELHGPGYTGLNWVTALVIRRLIWILELRIAVDIIFLGCSCTMDAGGMKLKSTEWVVRNW